MILSQNESRKRTRILLKKMTLILNQQWAVRNEQKSRQLKLLERDENEMTIMGKMKWPQRRKSQRGHFRIKHETKQTRREIKRGKRSKCASWKPKTRTGMKICIRGVTRIDLKVTLLMMMMELRSLQLYMMSL